MKGKANRDVLGNPYHAAYLIGPGFQIIKVDNIIYIYIICCTVMIMMNSEDAVLF